MYIPHYLITESAAMAQVAELRRRYEECPLLDLELSSEQNAVLETSRALGVDLLDAAARVSERERALSAGVWGNLVETGLVAPVDVEHGGGGLPDAMTSMLIAEGLAHGDAATAAAALWSGHAATLIGLCGTESQRTGVLPRFVTDPAPRAAVAMYEGYGRAPSEYETVIQAERGGWRVRGRKVAVPSGATADPLIVVGADPTNGLLRAAIVSPPAGVSTRASAHLGLDAANLSTLEFDVVVSEADLIGGPDGDADALAVAVSRFRLTTGAIALGCAQRAQEYAAHYVTERVAFGRPLAAFQGVAFLMADAHMQLDAARLQLWDVASRLDGQLASSLEREVSLAVNYSTSIAAHVSRDSLQVLGGHGFITDHPVERWYRATAGLAAMDCDPSCSGFAPAL